MVTIETRSPGRRRPPLPGWRLPAEDVGSGGSPLTLRHLIERVVRSEVAAFAERAAERRLVRFLSEREIAAQAARGRVDFGGRETAGDVDDDVAVGVALESFEDGLYVVLVDGRQCESLDAQVLLADDSHVTFLRLVPLVGG